MVLTGQRILIISSEPWGINKLSKHHYAEALCELGNEVFFAHPNNPDEANTEVKLLNDKVLRGLSPLPKVAQRKLMAREIDRILALTGDLDLVWSFDNSRLFHLDLFRAKKVISHVMDYDMDFQTERHATSADLCLGVTQAIVSRLRSHNSNSHLLGHGYRYQETDTLPMLPGEGEKKAIYVGNLLIPLIDRALLVELVQTFHLIDFHFVGSTGADNLNTKVDPQAADFLKKLEGRKNVFLHGAVQSERLTGMIRAADFCLLAYDTKSYPQQTANSHKVMEYLASGKPVFCTPMSEWNNSDLLTNYSSAEELKMLIQNLELYNNPDHVGRRRDYALDHSYVRQIERIEKLLND